MNASTRNEMQTHAAKRIRTQLNVYMHGHSFYIRFVLGIVQTHTHPRTHTTRTHAHTHTSSTHARTRARAHASRTKRGSRR